MSGMSKIHYRTTGGRKQRNAPPPPSVLAVIKESEAAKRKVSSTVSKKLKKFKVESRKSNLKNIQNEDPFEFFSLSHPPLVKNESTLQKIEQQKQHKYIRQKTNTAKNEKVVCSEMNTCTESGINKHQTESVAFSVIKDENQCSYERNVTELSSDRSEKMVIKVKKREPCSVKEVEMTDLLKKIEVDSSIIGTTEISTAFVITNEQTLEAEHLQRKSEQLNDFDMQRGNELLNTNIYRNKNIHQHCLSVASENILTIVKENETVENNIESVKDVVIKNIACLIGHGDKNSTSKEKLAREELKEINEKIVDSNDLETKENVNSENKDLTEKEQATKESSSFYNGVNIASINENITQDILCVKDGKSEQSSTKDQKLEVHKSEPNLKLKQESNVIKSQKTDSSIILSQETNKSAIKITENINYSQSDDDLPIVALKQTTNTQRIKSDEKIENSQQDNDLTVLTQVFHNKNLREKKNSSQNSDNLIVLTPVISSCSTESCDKMQKLLQKNELTEAVVGLTTESRREENSQKNTEHHILLNTVSPNKELLARNIDSMQGEVILRDSTKSTNNAEEALGDNLHIDNVNQELHTNSNLSMKIRNAEKELKTIYENEIKMEYTTVNETELQTNQEETRKTNSSPLLFDNTPPNETESLSIHNDDNVPISKVVNCFAELDEDLGVSTSQLKQLEKEYNQGVNKEQGNIPSSFQVPMWKEPAVRPRLPPLPNFTFDWSTGAQKSRQKLQSIVQDISRLNAVLAKARREIWHPYEHDKKFKK